MLDCPSQIVFAMTWLTYIPPMTTKQPRPVLVRTVCLSINKTDRLILGTNM